jgi:FixJ family two-component response regulator
VAGLVIRDDQFVIAGREDLPIVMLTGFGDLMTARGDRPAGVDVIVSKPVSRSELQRDVSQATASSH